jgi:hypothetical protein
MSKSLINRITCRVLKSNTGYAFSQPKMLEHIDSTYYPSPSSQPEFEFKYFKFDFQKRMVAIAYPVVDGYLNFDIDYEASPRSPLSLDRAIVSGLVMDKPVDTQSSLGV